MIELTKGIAFTTLVRQMASLVILCTWMASGGPVAASWNSRPMSDEAQIRPRRGVARHAGREGHAIEKRFGEGGGDS